MISSQPWQIIIGLSLGALLIGGITSIQILETNDDKPDKNQDRNRSNRGSFGDMFSRQDQYERTNRGSFGDMFKYTTAARPNQSRSSFSNLFSSRPVTRSRNLFGQNSNLDYNYRNRGTRSVNRNQGVFYNM